MPIEYKIVQDKNKESLEERIKEFWIKDGWKRVSKIIFDLKSKNFLQIVSRKSRL